MLKNTFEGQTLHRHQKFIPLNLHFGPSGLPSAEKRWPETMCGSLMLSDYRQTTLCFDKFDQIPVFFFEGLNFAFFIPGEVQY